MHKLVEQKITRAYLSSILLLILISCGNPEKKTLAAVDGSPIISSQVEAALGRPLRQLEQQIYSLKREKLEYLVEEKLLAQEAKNKGLSVAALLQREVNSKILPVTDDEISALYNANRTRIPVQLDKVREQIRDVLYQQRLTAQRNLFVQSLRAKAKIINYLRPPPVFLANISITGAPFKGTEKAKVTIVKFEDFQCPFCKQAQPALEQILSRYEGKVRVVHKDLPLDSLHPQARQAAEAGRCAGDQDKFWEYHDVLYANSPKAGLEELKSYAKTIGLNLASFDQCFSMGKYKAAVEKDSEEGARLGLTGTPVFFINGRELSGAQPFEALAAIIDEELARTH